MKKYDVLIIGAGPAGIFAARELVWQNPDIRVLLVDKGRKIQERQCPIPKTGKCAHCQPCAIMNGWAGAGAFSDGKLSLSPDVGGQLADYVGYGKVQDMIRYTDELYCGYGAPDKVHGLNSKGVDDIAYAASRHSILLVPCPVRHMGTETGFEVLKNIYVDLVESGKIEFRPLTPVADILVKDGQVTGAVLQNPDGSREEISAAKIIAAPGRGGAEWLTRQAHQLELKTINNAVDIGVRVETPNSVMDHLTRELYEAKLVYFSDTFENKCRTFCMNPGGIVSEENYEGGVALVNGHSFHDARLKTGNTNFALLVSSNFTEPFNQPIEYGKYIAKCANMLTGGGIMVQRLEDLIKGRRSDKSRLAKSTTIPTLKSAVPGDLSFVLPQRFLTSILETLRALDKVAPGLYSKATLLYGVEAKFYSSRIEVDNNLETKIQGLYAIGDGAGITRGLMQASVSGILAARHILGAE
ncbi:MAG: FAD-binding protein [Peptococcaceae bacterium]|nr:FAD-binding protein [Peptococcaceae bacterium]